jgi:hypothetical protein
MEIQQVRYFLAVAQELNFPRAAEKCNVSQPLLSRAIQQLEGELGGPLFHRERHLTHLIDLGEMVRPHLEAVYEAAIKAKRLSQDLSQLKRVPRELAERNGGTLTLAPSAKGATFESKFVAHDSVLPNGGYEALSGLQTSRPFIPHPLNSRASRGRKARLKHVVVKLGHSGAAQRTCSLPRKRGRGRCGTARRIAKGAPST